MNNIYNVSSNSINTYYGLNYEYKLSNKGLEKETVHDYKKIKNNYLKGYERAGEYNLTFGFWGKEIKNQKSGKRIQNL